eukprot:356535-Prymnesium_polylepis.1
MPVDRLGADDRALAPLLGEALLLHPLVAHAGPLPRLPLAAEGLVADDAVLAELAEGHRPRLVVVVLAAAHQPRRRRLQLLIRDLTQRREEVAPQLGLLLRQPIVARLVDGVDRVEAVA